MHNETRIDHFRGFAGYWAVKAGAETAMGGDWRKGPGKRLFDALTRVRRILGCCGTCLLVRYLT